MNINFSFWLLVVTISCAIIIFVDKKYFKKERYAPFQEHLDTLSKKEKKEFIKNNKEIRAPFIADNAQSLFFIFLVIFILRAFLFGNFLIPSASMTPTLPVGDLILVNKLSYGIQNPLSKSIAINTGSPKTGDIVVFHYPVNPKVDFIKRVVGTPGDVISYINKRLIINGKNISYTDCKYQQINAYNGNTNNTICTENLNGVSHKIDLIEGLKSQDFKNLVVPKNMYFVMGDNRDNSEDSRYWGFVPRKYLVGKAKVVWFSWNSLNSSIRWSQIGRTF